MPPGLKTKPKSQMPQSQVEKAMPGIEQQFHGPSAQYPPGHPSAKQGIQDARNLARQTSNFAREGATGVMKSGAKGVLNRIRGKKPQNEQNETKMRQKMQRAKKQLMAKAKKVADSKVREIAYANAADTFGLSVVAYYGIKHWKATLTILICIVLIFILLISGGFDTPQTQQGMPTTSDTCNPSQASNGQKSVCTITVTYSGSASDITVTDTILPGTTFVSAGQGGTYDKASNTVTWDAQKLGFPLNPINFSVTVTVQVNTPQKNTIVYNAYAINPTNLSGSTTGASCGNASKNTSDFTTLMTGQGRCANVLGSESSFVSTVIKNGGARFGLSAKQSELQALYQQATAKNVNPLIVLTIWGVEAGFQDNGTQFGCKPFGSGFNSQLTCSVNTLNSWMTYFDNQKTKPVKLTANCIYNDPFIFAYEKYTPVCVINDSNANARKNFVTYYKLLGGF